MNKTFSAKPDDIRRGWSLIDATGTPLGRLASKIAYRLMGKHKPEYCPHLDLGDYIVVVNAEKVGITGRKRTDKMYHQHTGYTGGMKSVSFEKMLDKAPERILELAVKGMLPKGPRGRAMFKKLKIYVGADHPHEAQQPQALADDGSK